MAVSQSMKGGPLSAWTRQIMLYLFTGQVENDVHMSNHEKI